ncbi:FAD-binding oxidoreductase [Paraneptunicella aestuarii]|uniref:NAD(P)/FAD-dependent oxidoreductase n=1 Tax=Paraneptunicella aestuarii TaxID=2831148 RepID=UPI001E4569EE|nr:FAD-binding oxidoreductase [Paraneptunicella aestuarii]UAA39368.1 FAD-binding oxidoreductase [Paraneptunicella aestuarii]
MYDPLTHSNIAPNQGYPGSFWAADTQQRLNFPQFEGETETDVVVIGGGYTGLAAALELRQKGVAVCLLEANEIGWGCAGRNAGFALPGSGRLGYGALKKAYGEEDADEIIKEFYAAPEELKAFIEKHSLDVDYTQGGYLKIAHKQKFYQLFEQQYEELPEAYRKHLSLVSKEQLSSSLLDTNKQHGGLYNNSSFGINPLKMALAMAELVDKSGGTIFCNSPVLSYERNGPHYEVKTAKGLLRSKYIILATNAYTPNKSLPALHRIQFPVLSSVLVTQPLSDEQLELFKQPGLLCMDTRALKYYYRLLPDNRLLFGGRGTIKGSNHDSQGIKNKLLGALKDSFPTLDNMQIDYYWSGWVSVSQDQIPHIGCFPDNPDVYYAMGYCGSGVAFTHTAGKRLAQLITAPEDVPELPIYWRFPKPFPLAQFRRLGLWGYYQWQGLMDLA